MTLSLLFFRNLCLDCRDREERKGYTPQGQESHIGDWPVTALPEYSRLILETSTLSRQTENSVPRHEKSGVSIILFRILPSEKI